MFTRHGSHRILCPICSATRERPALRFPLYRVLGVALLTACLTGAMVYTFWNPDHAVWLGVVAGMLCFLSVEVYYSVQFRRELECPVCRFDPILYKKAPERAKQMCLEGLKRQEQLWLSRWRGQRERQRMRELHG